MHTISLMISTLFSEAIAGRGLQSADRETYANGVRKVIYRDPDGSEIGFGGGPIAD